MADSQPHRARRCRRTAASPGGGTGRFLSGQKPRGLPADQGVPRPSGLSSKPRPRPQARGTGCAYSTAGGAWASCTPRTPAGPSRLLVTELGRGKPHGPLTGCQQEARGPRPAGCQNVPNADCGPAAGGPPTRLGNRARLRSTYDPTWRLMCQHPPASVLSLGSADYGFPESAGKDGALPARVERAMRGASTRGSSWPLRGSVHICSTWLPPYRATDAALL